MTMVYTLPVTLSGVTIIESEALAVASDIDDCEPGMVVKLSAIQAPPDATRWRIPINAMQPPFAYEEFRKIRCTTVPHEQATMESVVWVWERVA